ncbi:MAG: hypothetical protein ACRBBU_01655 [Pseudooceanicola sp.]
MDHSADMAVLTGDLVASTQLGRSGIDAAFDALNASAHQQAEWLGGPLRFSRHRGDGWQVALDRPEFALRSALTFRAALRARDPRFDTYVAIATGPVSAEIGRDLNAENDAVFVKSGRILDQLTSQDAPMRMAASDNTALNAVVVLADHLSMGWTLPQAAAMLHFLAPGELPTFTEAAKRMGKSRQVVSKALEAAGFRPLRHALSNLEGALRHV